MNYKDGISQKALADRLGISRVQVRRLIDRGIFKRDAAKKVSLSQAQKAFVQYQKEIGKQTTERSKTAAVKILNELKEQGGQEFGELYARWIANAENDPQTVLNSAKAYFAAVQTKEEKLKLDELERRLIPVERINADAERIGSAIRSKLLSLPARTATLCEGRTARDIEELLTDELNKALEDLQKLFI